MQPATTEAFLIKWEEFVFILKDTNMVMTVSLLPVFGVPLIPSASFICIKPACVLHF